MKWVTVRVSPEEADAVEELVTTLKLPYTKSQVKTESGPAVSYQIFAPDGMLDDVLANISKRLDARKNANALVVADVTAFISPALEKLQEKARSSGPRSSPLETITQRVDQYQRPSRDILILTVLATAVALAGLFLNNVAVIIGGMLISPLIGPINAISVDASLGRVRELIRTEVTVLALLAVAVGSSALVSAAASRVIPLSLTSEIVSRSSTNVLDVLIALILGVAAGLALMTEVPEALVGVAVAVALVPPAAVCGIGIALGLPAVFEGAALLTLTSLYGLNAGGVVVLLAKGVRPRRYYEEAQAKRFGAYSLVTFSVILLLLALFILRSQGSI